MQGRGHYLLIHPFCTVSWPHCANAKMIYWNVDKRIESYTVNNLKLLIYLLLQEFNFVFKVLPDMGWSQGVRNRREI